MKRLLLLFLFLPSVLFAAPDPNACIAQLQASFTCYAPGKDPKIEGPFETSKPGLRNTGSIPTTLDDVRLAAAQGIAIPVTLAMNPTHYGKYYNIGDITYTSALDGRTYTMKNVMGYVHDTGCAFWPHGSYVGKQQSCCLKYNNTCPDVYRKIDIAHGDYRPHKSFSKGGLHDVNNGPSCAKINKTVCQIAGPLTTPPTVGPGTLTPGNDQRMSLGNLQTGGIPGVNSSVGNTTSPFQNKAVGQQSLASILGNNSQQAQSNYLQTQNAGTNTALPSHIIPKVPAFGFLFSQIGTTTRPSIVPLSWAVLGSVSSCTVKMITPSNELTTLATGRVGTTVIPVSGGAQTGGYIVTLTCETDSLPFVKTTRFFVN